MNRQKSMTEKIEDIIEGRGKVKHVVFDDDGNVTLEVISFDFVPHAVLTNLQALGIVREIRVRNGRIQMDFVPLG